METYCFTLLICRKEELEAKIRKRVALEEKAFRIVESFLDGPVNEEDLTDAVRYLSLFNQQQILKHYKERIKVAPLN